MPAAVFPSVRILRSSASVLRTTSGRDTRSGPRSLPRASSPWQDAHAPSKAALATRRLAAFVLDAVVSRLFCELSAIAVIAKKQNMVVNRIKVRVERTDRFLCSSGMASRRVIRLRLHQLGIANARGVVRRVFPEANLNQFDLREQLFRNVRKRLHRVLSKVLKCASSVQGGSMLSVLHSRRGVALFLGLAVALSLLVLAQA